jgi:hypothetical protein
MAASLETLSTSSAQWTGTIPKEQWEVYRRVMDEAVAREIPFALGGAFALAVHTGYWRDTKDIDLYVLPCFRERMIQVVRELGLSDYYDKVPYDRWWIYRSVTEGTIVDIIWAMANHRAEIDELWMSGPMVEVCGCTLKVLPPEAMIWDKLYIMQRDRCDWPDVMNLLFYVGDRVDWKFLVPRIGEDAPLLAAALMVFRSLAPGRAQALPEWLWEQLSLPPMPSDPLPETDKRRVSLLDTRPWFGPDRGRLNEAQKERGSC